MKEELLQKIREELALEQNTLTNEQRRKKVHNIYSRYISDIKGKDTNRIYLCMGKKFKGVLDKDNKFYLRLPQEDEELITVAFYRNIETDLFEDSYIVKLEDCDEFESTHDVIYPEQLDNGLVGKNFDDIQAEFLITSIDSKQEYTVKTIKIKYGRRRSYETNN